MEHVVFFPGPDGAPSFRRCASLDEAVRYVEHLRNAEGVAEVSLHVLTPVPVSFRPYYRVEVSQTDTPAAEPVPAGEEALAAEPVTEPEDAPVAEPVTEPEPAVAAEPVTEPEPAPMAEPAPAAAAPQVPEQSANAKRSLGFFAR